MSDDFSTRYLDLLRMLLPYAVLDTSNTFKDLKVHARALELCHENADTLLLECFPDRTDKLLAAWERVYGIAQDTSISYAARIDALITAINASGSITIAQFISLAGRLGYTVTIDEFVPFMAGWNEAGDEVLIEEIIYVWQVNVSNSVAKSYFFESGVSSAGDSLNYFSDAILEIIFNRLKPAHTAVVFAYL